MTVATDLDRRAASRKTQPHRDDKRFDNPLCYLTSLHCLPVGKSNTRELANGVTKSKKPDRGYFIGRLHGTQENFRNFSQFAILRRSGQTLAFLLDLSGYRYAFDSKDLYAAAPRVVGSLPGVRATGSNGLIARYQERNQLLFSVICFLHDGRGALMVPALQKLILSDEPPRTRPVISSASGRHSQRCRSGILRS